MFDHSKYPEVPERTLVGLDRWARESLPPGDFLTGVLSNDLSKACSHADMDNREVIFEITQYVYNELPMNCWGSKEIMEKWRNRVKESEKAEAE